MAATAGPTLLDPKVLALVSSLSTTANTAIYTAPANEQGVKVCVILVTNKTASPVTCTLSHQNSAGTNIDFCFAASIPANGLPVSMLPDGAYIWLDGAATPDELVGSAGTASALNVFVYGIETA